MFKDSQTGFLFALLLAALASMTTLGLAKPPAEPAEGSTGAKAEPSGKVPSSGRPAAGTAKAASSKKPSSSRTTDGAAKSDKSSDGAEGKSPHGSGQPSATDEDEAFANDVSHWITADFPRPPGSDLSTSGQAQITVVLALLPDPDTSGFRAEFDIALAAIQRAAERRRYVIHRHWFPWGGGEEADDAPPVEARHPGWLLLRRDRAAEPGKSETELLVVYLVGERPGSGIDRAAFKEAMDGARTHRRTDDPFLILGPYFSGTALSLKIAIEQWTGSPAAKPKFVVVSGTATRRRNRSILEAPAKASVVFSATVNADDSLARGVLRFLGSLDVTPERIGQLTETSTDFGNDASRSSTESEAANETPLRIPFPMHIGRLSDDASKPTGGAAVGRDRRASVDMIPPLQRGGTAEAALLLTNTLAALSRKGFTDVGVLASSSRDKVFLVKKLREAAPDVRAHLFEASLALTADEKDREAMNGTIVVSSYPLFPAIQSWPRVSLDEKQVAPPTDQIQQFASDAAEGDYNAMLALLSKSAADSQLSRDLEFVLPDYVWPFGGQARKLGPSVWITVVTGGQFWPLAVYPADADDSYLFAHDQAATTQAIKPRITRGAVVSLGLLFVLVFALGNLLAFLGWPRSFRRCPFILAYVPRSELAREDKPRAMDDVSATVESLGAFVLGAGGLAMAVLYELPVCMPDWLRVEGRIEAPGFVAAALLALSSLGLVGVSLRIAGRKVRDVYRQRREVVAAAGKAADDDGRGTGGSPSVRRWPRHAIGVVFALMMVFGLGILLHESSLLRLCGATDGTQVFLFARLMHPGIGLTPSLPLVILVAAVYGACLFRLRVLRRVTRLANAHVTWRKKEIRDFTQVAQLSLAGPLLVGGALGEIVSLARLDAFRPRTLEGAAVDVVMAIAFGVTFAIAAGSTWRAWRLWRELREFLHRLAIHPAVDAFDSLPLQIASGFQTPLPGRLREPDVNAACLQTYQVIARTPIDAGTPGRDDGAAPLAVVAAGSPDAIIERLLDELGARWFGSGSKIPGLDGSRKDEDKDKDKDTAKDSDPSYAIKLREHYLALRMAECLGRMCDVVRTTLFIGVAAAVAAVLATTAYPFQPSGTLGAAAVIVTAIVVLVAIRIIVDIERNEVMSRIAKTTPGTLTPSVPLLMRFAGYVILPLGSLIGTRLPVHGTSFVNLITNVSTWLSR